ncbi:hypothetical protein BTVI_65897 [Pitangus sulphuratus]|nr:hypothetical protein BTVI_65897 [Pitangus sulphuratus]
MDRKLSMSQLCALMGKKANGILSCPRKSIASRLSDKTRRNDLKLSQGKFRLDIRKKFSLEEWSGFGKKLPMEMVESPSLEVLKRHLDMVLGTKAQWCYSALRIHKAKKDLGMMIDERLDMSWQCVLAAQKANCILGFIQSSLAGKAILPLYSTLVRRHQEYCIQLWGLQHRKDVDLLE